VAAAPERRCPRRGRSPPAVPRTPRPWIIALTLAIAGGGAQARNAPGAQVQDYRPVFQECHLAGGAVSLAIRRMQIDGHGMMLTVDPATLATSLQREQDWSCADTDDERQKNTRYIRAVRSSNLAHGDNELMPPGVIADAGILRGTKPGSFVTADLCPSRRPLDRAFLQRLLSVQSPMPLALSISGTWLTRHEADFQWLREQARTGHLQITWVDHSYHHPYVRGRPLATNFLLEPGIDMRAEILDTERALIAHGETPSVFFRFPGLISNEALMRVTDDYHLIVLGAGAWLARSPRARPGDVILVHANGNEPAGIKLFWDLLGRGKLPKPFMPLTGAP